MKSKTLLMGLILVAGTLWASAQQPVARTGNGNGRCNGTNKCSAFVDEDKNGTCDTYENRSVNVKKGKQNKAGNSGTSTFKKAGKQGKGLGFMDVDRDGVCDNLKTPKKK